MNGALKKSGRVNMTEGPLLKNILLFVLPLMATNLLQVFYTVADSMIVGLSKEQDAVGAIGTTTAMINLIVNIFIGCAVGAKVAVAQSIGARNEKETQNAVHTAMAVSVIFGLVCALIGIAVSRPVLIAMGNDGKLLSLADTYAKIYFLGVPFISVTNFAIAVIQANGDTKTPLYILTFSGLFHVLLSLFLVGVCGLSVEGAAAGTSVSNLLSAVLLVWRLCRDKSACRLSLRRIRLEKKAFLRILHIGLPAGLQSALFSLSHMVIQSSIVTVEHMTVPAGSDWQPVVKGSAVGASIESFGFTLVNATAQAAITFTGQNASAGKYDRVVRVRRCCYLVVLVLSILFAAIMLSCRDGMLSLYGIVRGEEGSLARIAYDTATTRMLFMFVPYFLLGFMEVGSGVMQGLGRSVTSTIVSLSGSVAFRILWIMTAFRALPTLQIIFLSYPISWLLTALAHYISLRIVTGKRARAVTADNSANVAV